MRQSPKRLPIFYKKVFPFCEWYYLSLDGDQKLKVPSRFMIL